MPSSIPKHTVHKKKNVLAEGEIRIWSPTFHIFVGYDLFLQGSKCHKQTTKAFMPYSFALTIILWLSIMQVFEGVWRAALIN